MPNFSRTKIVAIVYGGELFISVITIHSKYTLIQWNGIIITMIAHIQFLVNILWAKSRIFVGLNVRSSCMSYG